MQKFCRIALAVSLSLSSLAAIATTSDVKDKPLPVLMPESQHATSSKRITAQFTRAHYKEVQMNDELSGQIFDRYIKSLDYARNVFLASDVEKFTKYRDDFDMYIGRGKLDAAFEIFNQNLERRLQRYEYALTLLDKPFDFTKKEVYTFDREDAPWPTSVEELNELWRLKVKYDALNLTLAGKKWEKVQEILGKRYRYAIKRLKQSESEDVFQVVMNSFAREVEPHTSYLSLIHI